MWLAASHFPLPQHTPDLTLEDIPPSEEAGESSGMTRKLNTPGLTVSPISIFRHF